MKFKKIIKKIDEYVRKIGAGKQVKPKKLDKLHALLLAKQQRYLERLENSVDLDQKEKLELKIKVVEAQINKVNVQRNKLNQAVV